MPQAGVRFLPDLPKPSRASDWTDGPCPGLKVCALAANDRAILKQGNYQNFLYASEPRPVFNCVPLYVSPQGTSRDSRALVQKEDYLEVGR